MKFSADDLENIIAITVGSKIYHIGNGPNYYQIMGLEKDAEVFGTTHTVVVLQPNTPQPWEGCTYVLTDKITSITMRSD